MSENRKLGSIFHLPAHTMSRLRLYSTQEGARRTISVRNQYCPVVLSLEVLHSGVVNVEKRVTRTWHLC